MRAAFVVLFLVFAGCAEPREPVPEPISLPVEPNDALLQQLDILAKSPELRLETSLGTIRAILYTEWLPETTAHIRGLAASGFYDGLPVHRVVDDFVIQSGDPTGTGEGGSGPLGLSTNMIPLEIKEGLQFQSGAIGLARWTEDTGDSQWFIAEKPALHLDNPQGEPNELLGPYSLFGQVFDGLDTVRKIARVDTLPNDRPIVDVVVQEATLLPPPPDADLISLVRNVVANFEDSIHVGELEVPRFAVVGHPVTIRFTHGEEGCRPGQMAGWGGPSIPDGGLRYDWALADHDECTMEITHTFTGPGVHSFTATDVLRETTVHRVDVDVLPWHDAYAPYTGTAMNET